MRIDWWRQGVNLATALLLLAVCLWPAAASAQEDWDFTPDDLDTLTSSGGDLTFGPDSDWFPDNLKDNLKRTIKKVLKPSPNTPGAPRSDGVNVRDFYHGHVACPRPCSIEHDKALQEFFEFERETVKEAMGTLAVTLTEANLERYSDALRRIEAAARRLLDVCWRDGCQVIYHTYETNSPEGMKANDTRRNVRTAKDGEPFPYRPPPDDEGGWTRDYCNCLQFAFLISNDGRIHVTVGSTQELSKVTGSPMK